MNRITFATLIFLFTALVGSAEPPPFDLKGKSLATTFGELLPGFSSADIKARSAAQQQWQDICFRVGAPGNEQFRAEACALMTAKLDAQSPGPARLWLLTQLERIGREESVGALAALLNDKDDQIREAAVRALANNPSPKATERLTKQLSTAAGAVKVGVLNALGYRGDAAAVEAITRELKGDNEAAVAAARALGRISSPAGLTALTAARDNARGQLRAAIANGLLTHADRMTREKNIGDAATIYKSLNNPDEPRAIRLAALRGTIQTSEDRAGELILGILAGDDAGALAVAVGQIENLSGAALKHLTAGLDKLSVPSRVLVITAIAARGDRSQFPAALAAAKSSDVDVRRAGLHALGRIGDASVVEFLIDAMSGDDALARAATESLAKLSADGVDEKLVSILEKEKSPALAVVLIGVLERRKAVSAVPALLASANSPDSTVRAASFNALKGLALPEHARAMVAALLKTEKAKDRVPAELAIAAVCRQIPNPEQRAEPVLAAIKDRKENTKDLLPLLGRIGGSDSLKLIRDALMASDPSLRAAALAGICQWPDAAANDDLLALAEKGTAPIDRSSALRALIRINTTKEDRTPDERFTALSAMKKAMPLASSDDERRAILEGLGNIRHIETLHFVLTYLDQQALQQAACKGVIELAHSKPLREPNKAEFERALDRVIVLCKDKGLVERAKQYREGR